MILWHIIQHINQPMTNTNMKSHKYGMNLGQLTIKLAKKTSLVLKSQKYMYNIQEIYTQLEVWQKQPLWISVQSDWKILSAEKAVFYDGIKSWDLQCKLYKASYKYTLHTTLYSKR